LIWNQKSNEENKIKQTDRNRGQDRVVVAAFALNEPMQDLGVDLRDVGELDLVHLGAFAAGGRGLVGEGDVELLGASIEGEAADAEDILAAIIDAPRRKSKRVCEFIEEEIVVNMSTYICGAQSTWSLRMSSIVMRAGRVFSEGEMTTSYPLVDCRMRRKRNKIPSYLWMKGGPTSQTRSLG
jgi:hypothetical protein